MSTIAVKSDLSAPRRRMVELMQELGFGRIETLLVRAGDPVLNPPPRVVREVKLGVESIEDIGYAKGYVFALTNWREVLAGLDALRNERGMHVILIARAQIERFANPETDTYDRYSPRLHKQASALVQEWADEVLFATYSVHTKSTDEGFGRRRIKGIGTGERIIRTTERPAHVAKNRLGLPDEIPLDYRVYAAYLRGENPLAQTEENNDQPETQGEE